MPAGNDVRSTGDASATSVWITTVVWMFYKMFFAVPVRWLVPPHTRAAFFQMFCDFRTNCPKDRRWLARHMRALAPRTFQGWVALGSAGLFASGALLGLSALVLVFLAACLFLSSIFLAIVGSGISTLLTVCSVVSFLFCLCTAAGGSFLYGGYAFLWVTGPFWRAVGSFVWPRKPVVPEMGTPQQQPFAHGFPAKFPDPFRVPPGIDIAQLYADASRVPPPGIDLVKLYQEQMKAYLAGLQGLPLEVPVDLFGVMPEFGPPTPMPATPRPFTSDAMSPDGWGTAFPEDVSATPVPGAHARKPKPTPAAAANGFRNTGPEAAAPPSSQGLSQPVKQKPSPAFPQPQEEAGRISQISPATSPTFPEPHEEPGHDSRSSPATPPAVPQPREEASRELRAAGRGGGKEVPGSCRPPTGRGSVPDAGKTAGPPGPTSKPAAQAPKPGIPEAKPGMRNGKPSGQGAKPEDAAEEAAELGKPTDSERGMWEALGDGPPGDPVVPQQAPSSEQPVTPPVVRSVINSTRAAVATNIQQHYRTGTVRAKAALGSHGGNDIVMRAGSAGPWQDFGPLRGTAPRGAWGHQATIRQSSLPTSLASFAL
eukprot:jgi/Botrbrau1/674/Bobra.0161s0057.1